MNKKTRYQETHTEGIGTVVFTDLWPPNSGERFPVSESAGEGYH